ncbi:beta-galactosidase [Ructibacterium gallinarum]|uniref:Beta-galactosidase n=1 Tax=Ructibacterium gallinarum TaxID=2779355 RepID=A0A9D5R7Q1_9FIRM|nr:beta-galactosidase [Ructibacterium gallinarum]MBE5039087.1 beta-galactosidase [Ructibacterium gallinarum]
MYKVKNGLLEKNGKPVYCVGVSYYASYHERKVPVPPEGDRIGEMKKDLKGMVDAGFNLVRFAALGKISYDENGEVVYEGSLADALAKEADRVGIASMIRLQGYTSNPSGYTDCLMVNSEGKEMDTSCWYDFIQNSMHHKGILKDNENCTRALARHFKDCSDTACFLTYNEPHYPSSGIFDYHPDTVDAYRKWLVEKQIMTEQEANTCAPPIARPAKGESPAAWINWRLFSMQALSNFLNHSSDIAKAATGIETMTCLTTDPTMPCNSSRCVNFYDSAERMDAIGITHYYRCNMPEAYFANLDLDMAESAGALYGKPMWLVEYDARTDIPLDRFRRETYMALGSGCKAIMYYQWRGDHTYPDSPEGNGFGVVDEFGKPTPNFENAKQVVKLINKLSDIFIYANKLRSSVAILHSDYAFMYADAIENEGSVCDNRSLKNSWLIDFVAMYKQLRLENISPDIIRAVDLSENQLGVKVLCVPAYEKLSEEEKNMLAIFERNGGKIIVKDSGFCGGYRPTFFQPDKYLSSFELYDALEMCGVAAPVTISGERYLLHQTLKGDGYYVICITNTSPFKKAALNTVLKTTFDFSDAILYTFEDQEGKSLSVSNCTIKIDEIEDGAIIVLQ